MDTAPSLPDDVREFIEKIPGRFGWSFPRDQRTYEVVAAQMLERGVSTEMLFAWLGALYLAATNERRG
jgi:hypothetical protein